MVQSIATVIAHSREQLAGKGAQGRVSYVAHNLDVASKCDLEADCPADVVSLHLNAPSAARTSRAILRTLYLTPPD